MSRFAAWSRGAASGLLLIGAWTWAASATGGERATEGLRVTAIYGRAADGYTALVLGGDGEAVRVKAGDRLGDLAVETVAERWVTVRAPGAQDPVRLWLDGVDPGMAGRGDRAAGGTGSGAQASLGGGVPPALGPRPDTSGKDLPAAVPQPLPGGAADTAGSPPVGDPLPQERSLPELAQELRGLDGRASFQRPAEDLGQVLNPLLGLSPDAKVVELDSGPPQTFRDGIRYVLRTSAANEILRLTVETDRGRQRVMVFPGAAGEPAHVRTMDMGTPGGSLTPASNPQSATGGSSK